jgi:hypothetical protein
VAGAVAGWGSWKFLGRGYSLSFCVNLDGRSLALPLQGLVGYVARAPRPASRYRLVRFEAHPWCTHGLASGTVVSRIANSLTENLMMWIPNKVQPLGNLEPGWTSVTQYRRDACRIYPRNQDFRTVAGSDRAVRVGSAMLGLAG